MKPDEIISLLPYSEPFLFVDSIIRIDENSVEGEYKFKKDEFFYKGHFSINDGEGNPKNFPVTPGVILIETMAQIGVVCFGIFLLEDKILSGKLPEVALVSSEVNFYKPVFPGEKVTVFSEKVFFRLGKLKCNVQMKNERDEIVCKGVIAGMAKSSSASI